MRAAAIGDSIVNGYPFSRRDSWPALLEDRLGKDAPEGGEHWTVVNCGVNGETTADIGRRFGGDARGADLVMILAGTNDFIFTEASPEETMGRIAGMARKHSEGEVWLVTPILVVPEMAAECWVDGTNYGLVNQKLGRLRELLLDFRTSSPAGAARVLDLQAEYGRWNAGVGERAAYVDGLHPTKEGCRIIADFMKTNWDKWACCPVREAGSK